MSTNINPANIIGFYSSRASSSGSESSKTSTYSELSEISCNENNASGKTRTKVNTFVNFNLSTNPNMLFHHLDSSGLPTPRVNLPPVTPYAPPSLSNPKGSIANVLQAARESSKEPLSVDELLNKMNETALFAPDLRSMDAPSPSNSSALTRLRREARNARIPPTDHIQSPITTSSTCTTPSSPFTSDCNSSRTTPTSSFTSTPVNSSNLINPKNSISSNTLLSLGASSPSPSLLNKFKPLPPIK
ncbi:MAG: hypothetical protein V4489_06540 [Chlamydiota bacterium]